MKWGDNPTLHRVCILHIVRLDGTLIAIGRYNNRDWTVLHSQIDDYRISTVCGSELSTEIIFSMFTRYSTDKVKVALSDTPVVFLMGSASSR